VNKRGQFGVAVLVLVFVVAVFFVTQSFPLVSAGAVPVSGMFGNVAQNGVCPALCSLGCTDTVCQDLPDFDPGTTTGGADGGGAGGSGTGALAGFGILAGFVLVGAGVGFMVGVIPGAIIGGIVGGLIPVVFALSVGG